MIIFEISDQNEVIYIPKEVEKNDIFIAPKDVQKRQNPAIDHVERWFPESENLRNVMKTFCLTYILAKLN